MTSEVGFTGYFHFKYTMLILVCYPLAGWGLVHALEGRTGREYLPLMGLATFCAMLAIGGAVAARKLGAFFGMPFGFWAYLVPALFVVGVLAGLLT